MTINVITRLS